ncbi:Pentatricopeptide repeat-containing protein, chloroplastic [Glycine soja]|uniref:Pentatricopeptide repeat-containing protein, chloroplastic n=1 Tax=Glycine soja TaxID=3848 RepID=A0A445FDZ9_GLYSO|nr:Pentatricopeptide repeat-containing protein, chloroplastic [Glycine soja]
MREGGMVDRGKVGKQKKIKLTHLRQQQLLHFHVYLIRVRPRSLNIPKPSPIFTCPLTWVTSATTSLRLGCPPPPHPTLSSLPSILTIKTLDSSKCKSILSHLTPHHFDRLFLSLHHTTNPKTTHEFFHFSTRHCNFCFTVRSYCLLLRSLLASSFVPRARFLLACLIDDNVPTSTSLSFRDNESRLREIASSMLELDQGSDQQQRIGLAAPRSLLPIQGLRLLLASSLCSPREAFSLV